MGRRAGRRAERRAGGAAVGFGVLGLALTIVYAAQISSAISAVSTVVIGIGTCAALAIGPRLHRPAARAPWRLIAMAAVVFLVGVVIRPWAVLQHGAAAGLGDVFTLAGYAMLIVGLALMLGRRGGLDRQAVTDGVIVCLGAGLVATVMLALPAARIHTRPELISLMAGLYPFIDVVLLLLVLNLGFSTASRLPSFRLIALAMATMFIGDIGYAWIGAHGRLTGSAILDLPFLLTYTCFGAAALHPSMVGFSSLVARPVQPWSPPRLALIIPALACPLVVMARPTLFGSDRAVLIVASGGLIAALLVRAVSAVRGYARVQEGLLQQATHDGLTGLPNRVLLTQRIQALLGARRSPEGAPCLLFLDLDGFKLVNDHWGHETGDLLLIEVARRLVGLAGLDRTVARISGDEFVVAGSDGPEQAAALAAQIQQALSQPVELPSLELVVTGSIGIAGRTDQTGAEELLRDADMAMYRAKAEGRNRWMVFDASMRQTLRDRVEIELALRHAIRRGQLWVAYQPITDTFTQRTVGAEALVRWTHPVRGPIPPAEFIPVAEETGLITEIGTWVLQESLHQLAAWRDQGILPAGFSLSVNASTRQILDHALHDAIAQGLRHHHLDPAQLTVEITESVMMGNPETVSEVLGDLRALGIHLSVDDFGTGYSSLSYLSWFPVTGVKVDRAFVDGLGVDERDEAIVRAVVAMACALGLSVIAEGVETQRQREILCRLGVEQGQGWLWGTAVDGADFADRHLDVTGVQAGVGNSYAQ